MSRLDAATGNEGSEADRAAFRAVRETLGGAFFTEKTRFPPSDLFGPLLHAPRVTQKLLELGGALRNLGGVGDGGGALPEDLAELVALVVFAHLRDEAVAAGLPFAYRRPAFNHLPRAVAAGLRPETIRALLARDDAALGPAEAELAGFVRAVLTGSVDDGAFARVRERLGARRTLETVAYALLDFFFCRLEAALGLEDATEAELDALLEATARNGGASA